MTETIVDILIVFWVIVGAVFILVGSIGLVKLNSPMKRLHAPTKASTLGVGALLLASMINAFAHHDGSLHEMLIMAFLFVTAPISAHFISKVNIHRGVTDATPPKPQNDDIWATQDQPPDRTI
ncbi:Na+/H+ antiporter subunit G [Palleronia sp. LCG004]|uniref:Na+/H+ antiporter subunit G n=1 Tax=Palleronia sp. LCG004 TaxID=3079304 RepID=UPI002943AB7E|nr:Na+/H+ antiporter subunit G [Palleronia sp. LCG004]WOI56307.1 Na+/H+ antiporter subunit G [Palleronia sp. LCG004]